jgi:ABC-type glutathione transport system ATPase component
MDAIEKRDAAAEVATLPTLGRRVAMSLRDVAVSFSGHTAVRDVTFDVAANQVTSLIGPSGSGKTTLLRALNRLHEGSSCHGRHPSRRDLGLPRGHADYALA